MDQILLDTDVERAMNREGFNHPVLTFFDDYSEQLQAFILEYNKLEDEKQRQEYTRKNLGFFGEAVDKLGNFTLSPLELIAIWSKMYDIDFRSRYKATGAVVFGYCSFPLSGREGANRYWIEQGEISKSLFKSTNDKDLFKARLKEVSYGLNEIDFYLRGVRMSFQDLLNLASKGEKELLKKVDDRMKSTPLMIKLGNLSENYTNGIFAFSGRIDLE